MRSQEFITESLDQPYKILRWEKGDYGDVDAIARLDDGTFLSIMFNKGFKQETKEEAWSVEFFRNNSQEKTGEGDQQRVFATVLSAVETFVSDRVPGAKGKYKPNKIYFSASKEVKPDENQRKAMTRASLYDSLVQRYARALGFRAFRADTGNKVMYELSRIKPIAEDMSRRGFLKGAGAMAAGISATGGACADNQTDPNKLIAIVNINGESKEFNLTGRFKGDAKSQLHQAEDFITDFLEKRDINFSNLELRYQGTVLKTQNIGSVKEEQGVAETINTDILNKRFKHKQVIGNYTYTASIEMFLDEPLLYIKAYDGDKEIGHILFEIWYLDGQPVRSHIESGGTEVAPEYRGQGVASTMYAYAKMLGNDIRPSWSQTSKGEAMWKSWDKSGAAQHLTGAVEENFADGKKPGRKGLAKRVGVNCKQPVAKLRSIAANSSGERQRMAHWCANMKSGKKK